MKAHPCQAAGLKCPSESDGADPETPAPASEKVVLQGHSDSGFKCLWLSEWVGKELQMPYSCGVCKTRLSSNLSLMELNFWKRLKIKLLIPLGSQSVMKPVCMNLR